MFRKFWVHTDIVAMCFKSNISLSDVCHWVLPVNHCWPQIVNFFPFVLKRTKQNKNWHTEKYTEPKQNRSHTRSSIMLITSAILFEADIATELTFETKSSSLFHRSTPSQYPLLIGCHPFSPTNHLLIENHRSLIQICSTPSLESTPWFIPSASPVMSRLTSSFTCQLISSIITTLIIHHSFTLSLHTQNLPFQQILPTLDFFYLPHCLHDNGTCSSFYF